MQQKTGPKKFHKVSSTPHVFFDAHFNTFRLYAGNSLYAFCLTPELTLEHLYWGPSLPPGYDLRYLSQSSRLAHFNTVEAGPDSFQSASRIVIEAETLEELQKTWKESVVKASHHLDDVEVLQRRRMENYAWRILSKATQQAAHKSPSSTSGRYESGGKKMPDTRFLRSSSRADISLSHNTPISHEGTTAGKGSARRRLGSTTPDHHEFTRAMRAGAVATPVEGMASNRSAALGSGGGSGPRGALGAVRAQGVQAQGPQGTAPATAPATAAGEYSGLERYRRRSNSAPYKPIYGDDTSSGTGGIDRGSSRDEDYAVGLSISGKVPDQAGQHATTVDEYVSTHLEKVPVSLPPKPHRSVDALHSMSEMLGRQESHDDLGVHDHTHYDSMHQSLAKGTILDILNETRAKFKHSSHRHKHQSFERAVGKVGKGLLCVEYADHGTGDYRSPSFMVVDNYNGSNISPLRYRRHAIYRGKLPMPDRMPAVRCLDEREATTLVLTMWDANTGLEVDLIYVAMHAYDAVTRRAVMRNVDTRPRRFVDGDNVALSCAYNAEELSPPTTASVPDTPETPAESGASTLGRGNGKGSGKGNNWKDALVGNSKVIQKASSMTMDFEAAAAPFHLLQLSGSWGRERYVVETRLNPGSHSFGSVRGVSGHVHNPFAAVTIGTPSEDDGEVKGFSLIYSGNFLVEAEITEMGRMRVNMGVHHMALQWNLKHGTVFNTPEAVLVRSGRGVGGMSRALHRLYLDRLLPRNWSDEQPPVLLNSWEAKYFHVNHDNIVEMARQAAPVGINLIVLDDGWFGKRDNDESSLGDWVANTTKFPHGIKGLAEEVNAAGCKFGLWFEPEMVSEDSMLFALHPDWYLHVPGRPRQLSRNQMVLDMSRGDVRDFLFNSIAAILANANVEYIKWDMNRPLTEVYSAALSGSGSEVWQAEVSHRYVLGVYDLMDRITSTFPHVLLENCASGGGRFDPGMLYYSPQIWCSDNTDALTRMRIQYGTSLAYPARCIGAHVSTVPNHITGSTTRVRTRGFVAMCGTFGFELDLATQSPKELAVFQRQIELYRHIAPIVRWGDLYRLWDPFKRNLASWMYVSRDQSHAVVFAFSLNSDHWSNLVPRLQLRGLDPEAEYEVTEPIPNNITQQSGNLMIIETEVPVYQMGVNGVCLTGAMLMHAGLPLKFYTLDDSHCFILRRMAPEHHSGPTKGESIDGCTVSSGPSVPSTGSTESGTESSAPEQEHIAGGPSAPHLHGMGAASSVHTNVHGSSSYSTLRAFQHTPTASIYGPTGGIVAFRSASHQLDTAPHANVHAPGHGHSQSGAGDTSQPGAAAAASSSPLPLSALAPALAPAPAVLSEVSSLSVVMEKSSFDNLYMPMSPSAEISMPMPAAAAAESTKQASVVTATAIAAVPDKPAVVKRSISDNTHDV